MAIVWGAYNGDLRLGIDSSVVTTATQAIFTWKCYTDSVIDFVGQQCEFDWGGTSGCPAEIPTSYKFTNNRVGPEIRQTVTYHYTYPAGSYDTSPGNAHVDNLMTTNTGDNPRFIKDYPIPARIYNIPAAPTSFVAKRVSDQSVNLTWVNNATTTAPVTNQTIEQRVYANGVWGAWTALSTINAQSLNPGGLSANRIYQYRIKANNLRGSSAWVTSGEVAMTPVLAGTPTGARVAPDGATLRVSWTTLAYGGGVNNQYLTYVVQRSTDGAAFVDVATLAGTVTSWVDGAPPGVSNVYQIKQTYDDPWSLPWVATTPPSSAITTARPPLAPTLLLPGNSPAAWTQVNFKTPTPFTWQHNPGSDNVPQSDAQIRFSTDGGVTWAAYTNAATTQGQYTVPANTLLQNNISYLWSIRTMGLASGGWSPWAAPFQVVAGTPPTVEITANYPPNILTSPPFEVRWTFTHVDGLAQVSARLEVSEEVSPEEWVPHSVVDVVGAAKTATITAPVINGRRYRVDLTAVASNQMRSPSVRSVPVTINFPAPATGVVTGLYDDCLAVVELEFTVNAAQAGVTSAAVRADIQRKVGTANWATILTGIPITAGQTYQVVDVAPASAAANDYRVIYWSAASSSGFSAPVTVSGTDGAGLGEWVFLSYGEDFSTVLRFHGDPSVSTTSGRVRETVDLLGRPRPALLLGDNVSYVVKVGGSLHWWDPCDLSGMDEDCVYDSSVVDWETCGRQATVVLYRDFTGRRLYGMLSDVSTSDLRPGFGTVDFTLTEIDVSESSLTAYSVAQAGVL